MSAMQEKYNAVSERFSAILELSKKIDIPVKAAEILFEFPWATHLLKLIRAEKAKVVDIEAVKKCVRFERGEKFYEYDKSSITLIIKPTHCSTKEQRARVKITVSKGEACGWKMVPRHPQGKINIDDICKKINFYMDFLRKEDERKERMFPKDSPVPPSVRKQSSCEKEQNADCRFFSRFSID